jgi:hypothetical protein
MEQSLPNRSPRRTEGHVRDALDLGHAVAQGVEADPAVPLTLDPFGLGEVDAAGQLPNHQDVESAAHDLFLERRCAGERRKDYCGAEVCIQAEDTAQRRSAARSGCSSGGVIFHLGPPTEPNRWRLMPADLDRCIGKGFPLVVDAPPLPRWWFSRTSLELFFPASSTLSASPYHRPDSVTGQYRYAQERAPVVLLFLLVRESAAPIERCGPFHLYRTEPQ